MGEFESLWEAAGRRVGSALDDASAVVVVGHDPIATAAVALGIGRVQSQRRRVAVGDLIGDVEPLRQFAPGDDVHGITDSFLYGVSLNKIARPIDAAGNLHVLPSGTEPVVQEEILRNDRWRRLARGFNETGALLLLASPAAVPGVDQLIDMLDGVVLVGDTLSPSANAHVFARVPSAVRRPALERATAAAGASQTTAKPSRRRWVIPSTIAALLLLGAAVYFGRSYAFRPQAVAALQRDSAAASAESFPVATPAAAVIDSTPVPTPANVADSSLASAYAVRVAMLNTEDGAAIRVRRGGGDFPAATYAPIAVGADTATFYTVLTGAYATRGRAEALLQVLRQRGLVGSGLGAVVRTPYALQVASAPSQTEAAAVIADLQSRRVPVYGLLQRDGSVRVYAGAFETPEQSSLLASSLRSANIDATLVYRVGRAF